MGNRAVITLEDEKGQRHPVALYVHWHGGLESTLAFVETTWEMFERGRDDLFTFHARLCQVIGNFFPDGLSLYAHAIKDADTWAASCDNGRWHFRVGPSGVTLPDNPAALDRARGHEYWKREHPIQEILRSAMPKTDAACTAVGGTAPVGVAVAS